MKFRAPSEPPASDGTRAVSPRPVTARDAGIEKELARYIQLELTCGHFTTWETDLLYSFERYLGHLNFYCERCADFFDRKKKPVKTTYPQTPLF